MDVAQNCRSIWPPPHIFHSKETLTSQLHTWREPLLFILPQIFHGGVCLTYGNYPWGVTRGRGTGYDNASFPCNTLLGIYTRLYCTWSHLAHLISLCEFKLYFCPHYLKWFQLTGAGFNVSLKIRSLKIKPTGISFFIWILSDSSSIRFGSQYAGTECTKFSQINVFLYLGYWTKR